MVLPGGVGGIFNSPEQSGMLPYVNLNEPLKEASKSSTQVGTSQNVTLSKDINDVPLIVKSGHIGFQPSIAGKPILDISWLQFRQVDKPDNTFEKKMQSIYQELWDRLPLSLKKDLEANEQRAPAKQDTDLLALHFCLEFEARLIAVLTQMKASPISKEASAIQANIPADTLSSSIAFAHDIIDSLGNYTEAIGSNHEAYEALSNILKETKTYLQMIER